MRNSQKNWFVVSKMTRIWWILTWALKILKMSTLIGFFCAKYITFDRKKYRAVIFLNTAEWCKIWRKTDLWSGKWHEEYWKFSPEHLKVSISKVENLWPWNLQRSYVSWQWRMMQDFKRNWIVISKLTLQFDEFWPKHQEVSKKLHFNGLLLTKVDNACTKKVQKSYVWWHWRLMQNLNENWLVLSKMTWGI